MLFEWKIPELERATPDSVGEAMSERQSHVMIAVVAVDVITHVIH